MSRIVGICASCRCHGGIFGRGLCSACYSRHRREGTLDGFDTARRMRTDDPHDLLPTLPDTVPGLPCQQPLADPEHDPWFDLGSPVEIAAVKAACRACPARRACRDLADAFEPNARLRVWGVYGGETPAERIARRSRAADSGAVA